MKTTGKLTLPLHDYAGEIICGVDEAGRGVCNRFIGVIAEGKLGIL